MKTRILCLLLAMLLTLSLFTGCGAKEAPAAEEPAPAAEAPAAEEPAAEEPAPAEPGKEAEEPEVSAAEPASEEEGSSEVYAVPSDEVSAPSLRDEALNFVDAPVADLIAAIGEPDSSSYASSCDGPGEDGELYYADFTVYTYREDGEETVVDVW